MARPVPSHQFLANPTSQLAYLYLTAFVKAVCEHHFQRPLSAVDLLDWGCGKGQTSYLLRKLGADPTSCDLALGGGDSSFHQETPILDRLGIQVDALDHPSTLPYQDRSMDAVLSVGVLEHVADDRASLAEIHRILRPGGLFVCFFLPQSSSWTQRVARWRGNIYHDRLYSRRRVRHLLDSAGFELLDLWRRQLLPKNSVRYPAYRLFERADQWLTEHTPLRHLATNIEFVAVRPDREECPAATR